MSVHPAPSAELKDRVSGPLYVHATIPILFSSIIAMGCVPGERSHPDENGEIRQFTQSITQETSLSRYDLSKSDPVIFKLPDRLGEISGLAMTDDGRLFCHDDESPVIYEFDYRAGEIVKRFSIGSGFMEEDFEGIAVKKDTFFLVNSGGDIFEFRETDDRRHADFRLYRTFLSERNDVEGLEYDPVTDCLLLACKAEPEKGAKNLRAIYEFSLKTRKLNKEPRFLISLKEAGKRARKGRFNPSGIALDPATQHFIIISADGESAIELDRSGAILDQQEIPKKTNKQPEGIAFAPDGSLLLANDGQGDRGTLVVYRPGDF